MYPTHTRLIHRIGYIMYNVAQLGGGVGHPLNILCIQNTYSPKDLRDIAKKGSLILSKKSPRQRTSYMKVWKVCTSTSSERG